MLEAVAVVFFVLWAVGLSAAYTFGGMIHLLLAGAMVAVVARWALGSDWREDA